MNELSNVINVDGIECYEKDGTAYLKLETVARGLGFVDASKGVEYVRWNTVRQYLGEIGFSQEVAKDSFIPENVFYRLAMKAKNEAAERFQAKIADEVIPAIRKHGAYMTPQTLEQALLSPDFLLKLAQRLKEEQEEKLALLAENEEQRQAIAEFQPIRQYIDTILSSTGTIATSQIAADYDISAKRLNKILHEEGLQHCVNGQWILYRIHMGKGYTKSETISITRSDGTPDTKIYTKWTQKGRLLIHEILTRRGIFALMDREIA